MRRFTSKSTAQLEDEVAQLTALVEEMKGRLERLEGGTTDTDNGDGNARSRRDLLKLAGAAAGGAAGAVVLGSVPAAAATNDPMVNGVTNQTGATTNVVPSGGASPSPVFQALGQGVTAPTVPVNSPNQSIPLIGAIGPGGSLPLIGTPPVNDYPGYAPIQGVGGVTIVTVAGVDQTVSEGINGWGKGKTGIGITGESDVGYGVVGGSGGIDLAALGNGRVLQVPLPSGPTNSLLSNPPSGPPNYKPNDFEQVRDENGVIWVSHPAPGGSQPQAYWRRLNTMIPITPVRVVDTRNGAGGVSGIQPVGSTRTWAIAGGSGVPATAVGLMGNLTAAAYTASGYLAIFPGGTAWPGNSTVNFSPASYAWANSFVVLFGAGGTVSVYMGATSHVIIDVIGYIQ